MARVLRWHVVALVAGIALILAGLVAAPSGAQGQQQGQQPDPEGNPTQAHPFAWAYVGNLPGAPEQTAEENDLQHLPGTDQAFTLKQIRDTANPVDWYPGDHPPMPQIVAHRRSPGMNPWIGSCGLCHLPNGKGRPENAPVAGLPKGYILQQLADFKAGARRSADQTKRNTMTMEGNATGITHEEAEEAAAYFSSLKYTPWIKVEEVETVPHVHNIGGFFAPIEGSATEPLGDRILEMPVNAEYSEKLRSPRSPWIAYVPVGSIKKGEDLVVRGGSGKTVACAACHGEGLKGNENFPPLAGRSPSYLARQLYDMKHYTRNGAGATLMRPIVQNLSDEDILDITAYLASLQP